VRIKPILETLLFFMVSDFELAHADRWFECLLVWQVIADDFLLLLLTLQGVLLELFVAVEGGVFVSPDGSVDLSLCATDDDLGGLVDLRSVLVVNLLV